MCGEMVQVYAGLREEEFRKATAEYFHATVEEHIYPEMLYLVARVARRSGDTGLVSSTNN